MYRNGFEEWYRIFSHNFFKLTAQCTNTIYRHSLIKLLNFFSAEKSDLTRNPTHTPTVHQRHGQTDFTIAIPRFELRASCGKMGAKPRPWMPMP